MALCKLAQSLALVGVIAVGAMASDEGPPSLAVEGYTDRLSYLPGESIGFHVSTTAAKYSMEITRLGDKPQVVYSKADLAGLAYPIPEDASSHGCRWPVSFRLAAPAEWRSGYYNVRLRVADAGGLFVGRNRRTAEVDIFFIIRSTQPGKDTAILLELCTNTYNAYNNWGGSSLYAYHGRAEAAGASRVVQPALAGQFRQWELSFVTWAERNGYKLDFCANSDLEFHPETPQVYKLVLSVGHDEYWSAPCATTWRSLSAKEATSPSSAAIPAAGKSAAKKTAAP